MEVRIYNQENDDLQEIQQKFVMDVMVDLSSKQFFKENLYKFYFIYQINDIKYVIFI